MWFLKYFIFIGCFVIASSDNVVQNVMEQSEINDSLSESIVVYGIISELANRNINVSSMCAIDLTNIFRGINKKDMWAVKVMDASGTYQSSFVWGENAWLGSKVQCDCLNTPPKKTISPDILKLMDNNLISTIATMEMNYKMIFLLITSPYKVDTIFNVRSATATHRLGLCLPKTCSNEDVELLSKSFFSQRKLNFQKLYNATMEVINVKDMDVKNFLNRSEVIGILFTIGLITALAIVLIFVYKYVQDKMDALKSFFRFASFYMSFFDTRSTPYVNDGLRMMMCSWVFFCYCSSLGTYVYDNVQYRIALWSKKGRRR